MSVVNSKPWHVRANCRGVDPAIFFPEPIGADPLLMMRNLRKKWDERRRTGKKPNRAEKEYDDKVHKAREICVTCPVFEQCRTHVDAQRLRVGTYAGETSEERRVRWKREGRGRLTG